MGMENSYQGAVTKAKEAIGQISDEVDKLDKKLKSVVETLQDYQKKGIPSKVTDQLKEQSSQIKTLEATVKSLTEKLTQQAQAEKNLANVKNASNTITNQQTASISKLKSEYNDLKTQQQTELKALRDLEVQGKQNTKQYQNASQAYKDITARIYEVDNAIKKLNPNTQKQSIEKNLLNKILRENAVLLSNSSNAYQKLVVRMNQVGRVVQSLTAKKASGVSLTNTEIKQLATAERYFKKYQQAVLKADAAIGRHQRNVGNYQSALGKLNFGLRSLMSAFGVIGGVTLFANLVKDAFSLTRTLDSMAFSMRAVITDSRELGQTQEWLRKITEDYGAELVTTTNRYIKFRAAAQQAGFTAQETQNIFGTMTKAAGVLGLKTDELQGVFLALEQMISKGKITTEELRRQLGERLPGAMDIMARSMGKTTAELDKMMKAGEVITKDVLPGFAEEVERAFGLDSISTVDTLQAATMRLKNAWTILIEDFNKGNDTTSVLRDVINKLANNLGLIVNIVTKAAGVFLLWKASVITAALASNVFNGALKVKIISLYNTNRAAIVTSKGIRAFTASLLTNPLSIFVVALGALIAAFWDTSDSAEKATKEIIDSGKEALGATQSYYEVTKSVEELYERYKALTQGMGDNIDKTKLNAEENKELETIISKIGLAIPGVVTEVDRYSKALKINTTDLEDNIKKRKEQLEIDAGANLQTQSERLAELKREDDKFTKDLAKNRYVRIKDGEKEQLFIMKNGELMMRVKNGMIYEDVKADAIRVKIFNDHMARTKDEIASLEELSFANKLILFETTGQFEAETRAYREKKQQEDDLAKSEQEAFENSSVLANMQKEIDDAEAKRNDILKIKKIDNEKEYQKAIEEARSNLLEKDKDAYNSSVKALEEAQKKYNEFTDKKGQKKGQNLDNQLEREEERRLKARIKAEKAALKAKEENAQAELQISLTVNDDIIEDDLRTKKERLDALTDYIRAAKDSEDSNLEYQKAIAWKTYEEINESKIRSDEEKATAYQTYIDKVESLDKEYFDNLNKLRQKNNESFENIVISDFERRRLKNDNEISKIAEQYDFLEKKEMANFELEKSRLDKQFADNKISQEDYDKTLAYLIEQREQKIQKIQRESFIEQTRMAIEFAKVQAELIRDPDEREAELHRIAQLEMDFERKIAENKEQNAEDELAELKRIQALKEEILTTSANMISQALDLDADKVGDIFRKIHDTISGEGEGIKKTAKDILATIGEIADVTGQVFDSIADRNIERIDAQIDANNEYYDKILENEEIADEQREALEKQRDRKNKILEKKKKDEQIKQAQTAKLFGAFNIAIQTAIAAISALAAPPIGLGPVAGVPLAALVGAMGAASIALTLSRPIPKFEKGTLSAPEGIALVDENVPEVHTDKFDRVKSYGMNKPNLRYLEKGDKIYPSHKRFFDANNIDNIQRFALNMNAISNGDAITNEKMEMAMINTIMGMRGDMNAMGKKMEKLAQRPINNNVKVKIEQDNPY